MKGIDLNRRGDEVRKLFFAGFGQQVIKSGYDPEDVLQEIYRGLLVRNQGTCPFDETKSSFGHYVHMVCDCIIKNYHRKESRKRKMEQLGMSTNINRVSEIQDAALAIDKTKTENNQNQTPLSFTSLLLRVPENTKSRLTRQDREDMRKIIPLLIEGASKKEIQEQTGIKPSRMSKVMVDLRKQVQLTIL